MAHVAKYTKAASGHMCAHYDRTAINISNENINSEKTKENYNLAPIREITQNDFIQERCVAIQCMKRKDVNVMCSWLVTAPKDLPVGDNKQFFEESYKFLLNRYGGEKNVVSAYVHMDEITPHMHFAFVPVVMDKNKNIEKVSAKELINRADLRSFHQDLENHLAKVFGRDLGILNEATKEGNKSVAELKRGQAIIDLENAQNELVETQSNVNLMQDTEKSLQAKIDALEGHVLTVEKLNAIKPQKTFMGTIKGVSIEQIQDLKKTALQYHKLGENYLELKNNYSDLQNKYTKTKDKIPTLHEQIEMQVMKKNYEQLKKEVTEKDKILDLISDSEWANIEKLISQALKSKKKDNQDLNR